MSEKRLDRSAGIRAYLAHFFGIKRLLVTIALLSATTYAVDVANLKDVSTTEPDHRAIPSRISGARLWWNRGKRSPVKHSAPVDDNDDDDDDGSALSERTGKSSASTRAFGVRYFKSPGQRTRRTSSTSNAKARHARRRDGTRPTVGASFATFRDSLQEHDRLTVCNATERCYREWKVRTSFYAEEPSWIDIDENYGETNRYRDRLDTIDPFVVTRGKKIGGSSDGHVKGATKGLASSVVDTGTSTPSKRVFTPMANDRFGETTRRTRAEDRRAILLDILSMSDPFYAVRGKRRNVVTGIPLRQLRAKPKEFDRPDFERRRYFPQSHRFPWNRERDESK